MATEYLSTPALKPTPGPRGYPFIGPVPQLLRDPLQFINDVAQQYGDIVSWRIGPQQFFLLNHQDHFKHILLDNYRNYPKGVNYKTFKRFVGEGIALSEGPKWLRQRRLAQPAFHHQRLAALVETMADSTAQMIQRWQPIAARGDTFNIAEEMRQLTLEIIVTTMFSSSIGGDIEVISKAFDTALNHITRTFWLAALPSRLIPGNRRFEKAIDKLDEVIYQIINDRRRTQEDRPDLLTMFLNTRDEDTGESMDNTELRDTAMSMFLAGHETSSNALSWAFHMLTQHPEVASRVHAEVDTVLGGRVPTFQDVPRLTYTKMVIEETLRLYPVAWVMFRSPVADDVISGHKIPAGSAVVLAPYALHRSPTIWENPEQFDPERFTPERVAARPRFAYMPFSGGPRQCIGNTFAIMEMQLIIAMIFQRYQVRAVPGHKVEPHIAITMQPRGGLPVTLHPRSSLV